MLLLLLLLAVLKQWFGQTWVLDENSRGGNRRNRQEIPTPSQEALSTPEQVTSLL